MYVWTITESLSFRKNFCVLISKLMESPIYILYQIVVCLCPHTIVYFYTYIDYTNKRPLNSLEDFSCIIEPSLIIKPGCPTYSE